MLASEVSAARDSTSSDIHILMLREKLKQRRSPIAFGTFEVGIDVLETT
jgi:hypothetical protein